MKKPKKTPEPTSSKPQATDLTGPAEVAEAVLAIAVQAGVPVFLYSEPGCGKSVTVRSIASSLSNRLHTIMLAVREPTDQGGLPAVFDDGREKSVRIVPPGWARQLMTEGGGIVFFDEMSNATPATMNSALRIVQEGVVGDGEQLPSATRFVMAGNPPETNVGANEITAGIANRCLHLRWPFDYARWRAGMLSRWKTSHAVPLLPSAWRAGEQTMAELVVAFLDTRPDLAQKQPSDIAEQGKAWPSGRTWDLTVITLAAAASVGYGPRSIVALTVVEGLVGPAVRAQWASWLANRDLPSIEKLLANAEHEPIPTRIDQTLAVLAGVVERIKARPDDQALFMSAWTVLNRVMEHDPSIAVPSAQALAALAPQSWARAGTPFLKGLTSLTKHLGRAQVDYGAAR